MTAPELPADAGDALAAASGTRDPAPPGRVVRMTGIIASDGRDIECMDEISDEAYSRYEHAAADLRAFARCDTYGLVLRAEQRFRTRCAAYGQRAAAGEMPVGWRTAFTDLLGELLSCLSAIELFLQHCDRQLGADPATAQAHSAFRAARDAARAESFAFRFLEGLRGYVQRSGLPPGRVGAQLRLSTTFERRGHAVVLELFPDELDRDGPASWTRVLEQAVSGGDPIDLAAMLTQMVDRLDGIMRAGLGERLAQLAASADIVAQVAGPALTRDGEAQMIALHLDVERDVVRRVEMQPVPGELVDLVRARQPSRP